MAASKLCKSCLSQLSYSSSRQDHVHCHHEEVSTPEQKEFQKNRRNEATAGWVLDHLGATLREAFQAGYAEGWLHFQTRKEP